MNGHKEKTGRRFANAWALAGRLALWLLLATLVGWGTLAIAYSNLPSPARIPASVLFALGSGWLLLGVRPRWKGRLGFFTLLAAVLCGWLAIPPSNDRDWQADVAVLPHADIAGNQITIHNLRNCYYRSETDYDVRHDDRTFDLSTLRTVDLYLVYWGSPHMAHTMASFGFDTGEFVCISIETRKEKGEGYSAVKGLFRQFELAYIIGDERDLVRLRTNYRQGEEVYLYRVHMTPEQARTLFLDYLRRVNQLHQGPEWYNAVTANCSTAIRTQRAAAERAPWDWRMLANGHLDELLYERGVLSTHLPFAELRRRSHINARARSADRSPAFSQLIRQGLRGYDP